MSLRQSFNDIVAAYEKKHGVSVKIRSTPVEELKEAVAKNPDDVLRSLRLAWALGVGTVGFPLDNDLFPGWNPKPVIHYI